MKLLITCLLLISTTASAWGPFKQSGASAIDVKPAVNGQGRGIELNFNPKELLESRKPEFYNEALVRLERLEDHPLCHRVAAQLLMKNCRGLDGVDKQIYQLNSDQTQKHHIEAFTASLTVCEMEEVSFEVPEACLPFSSASIFSQARDVGHLMVSREQTVDCKTAIHQNPSNQHIWSNFVTSATVFCRAASSELENDQHILLHKELFQNMAKFSEAIHEDLETMRKKMAENARAADSYSETLLSNANEWTAKLKQAFQSTSKDIEEVNSAMDSVAKNSKNAAHMMSQFVKSIYESTAEVSAEQGKALAVGTNQVQRQIHVITNTLLETQEGLANMANLVNTLVPAVKSLTERVDASDTQFKATLNAVSNATDALEYHVQKLDQLTGTASDLNEQLEQATANAQSWRQSLSQGILIPDWTIQAGTPLGMVALGNIVLDRSVVSNALLGFAGLFIGQIIVWIRTPFVQSVCQLTLTFINFISSTREPSAVTQKARVEKAASMVVTPVEFDSPSHADSNGPRPEVV
ncbi:hypothetical protein BKA64DRAFT_51430 [Cadophora sp. MPI-SDFR-AT-0126]|nr:hypothetical protein BKA64DRAFT_51430 [Leotiomycetes sp. MPI-SDFR-AT-0126]